MKKNNLNKLLIEIIKSAQESTDAPIPEPEDDDAPIPEPEDDDAPTPEPGGSDWVTKRQEQADWVTIDQKEAPSAKAPVKSVSKPSSVPARSNILKMQELMQEFVKIVFKGSDSPGQTTGQFAQMNLGYFLTTHYSPEYEGFEHQEKDKLSEKGKKKKTTDFASIMDSMKSIGGAMSRSKPDGIWGPRTQTGIKSIAQFAGTLVQFSTNIKYPGADFTSSDKQELDKQIPDAEYPSREKPSSELSRRAAAIVTILQKLNTFASDLDKYLSEKYAQYSAPSGEKSKFQAIQLPKGPEKKPIEELDRALLSQISGKFSVTFQNTPFKITLLDLYDYSNFIRAIRSQLTGDDVTINKWIEDNFANLVEEARKQIISSLQHNKLLLTAEESEEVKKLFEAKNKYNQLYYKFFQLLASSQGGQPSVGDEQEYNEINKNIFLPSVYRNKVARNQMLQKINSLIERYNQGILNISYTSE